jgi:hypothetical protein
MSGFGQWVAECKAVLEEEWESADSIDSSDRPQTNERQQCSEVALFDHDWLSTPVVDPLADQQQDWIGLLQSDWKIELYNLNLLGLKDEKNNLKHSCLSVQELIFLIRDVQYKPLIIFHQQHWGYTCCLQIAGLGRVRLVVCFNNPQCFGRYAAFVTNRLDWSARHVISHWIQHHPATNLYGKNSAFEFCLEDSLQLA